MSAPDFHPMDLSGRRFLITGAGSGIGRASAVLLEPIGGQGCLR